MNLYGGEYVIWWARHVRSMTSSSAKLLSRLVRRCLWQQPTSTTLLAIDFRCWSRSLAGWISEKNGSINGLVPIRVQLGDFLQWRHATQKSIREWNAPRSFPSAIDEEPKQEDAAEASLEEDRFNFYGRKRVLMWIKQGFPLFYIWTHDEQTVSTLIWHLWAKGGGRFREPKPRYSWHTHQELGDTDDRYTGYKWGFPTMGVPENGGFIR